MDSMDRNTFLFIIRYRIYLWIGLAFLALALGINYLWTGVRDWSLHTTVTGCVFWSAFFGTRWAIEDWVWYKKTITREDIITRGDEPRTYPNLGTTTYAVNVIAVELPDHKVSHWAKSVLVMHKHGKVNLTETKWSGNGKLFSQPAYRWMKQYLTEQGALKKGAWKTAPHTVSDVAYLEEVRTGRKKIPPPPPGWH